MMSYISSAFFVSMLWIVHAVFSCYVYIRLYFRILLGLILRGLARVKTGRGPGLSTLLEAREQLSKLPQHIAFLLLMDSQEEQLPWEELASLILWSIGLGIHTISLYDLQGRLKLNQDRLLLAISNQRRQLMRESAAAGCYGGCRRGELIFQLCWRTNAKLAAQRLSGEEAAVIVTRDGRMMYPDVNDNNSSESGPGGLMINWAADELGSTTCSCRPLSNQSVPTTVSISLLSPEDGKGDIVRCARLLSSELRAGLVKSSGICEDMISQRLVANKGMSDPSLLVRIGQAQSNAHFLPWQIRLTEIHSLESLRGLRQQHLIDILRRFSGCEQRFGK